MKIQMRKINEIVPYVNNPRNNAGAIDKVAGSIQEFGFNVPLVLDKYNVIICGHTRYQAAQKLGIEEVPCICADKLTPAQVKAYRIADNKTAEFSEWDFDLLSIELEQLQELNFDLELTSFEDFEIQDVFETDNSTEIDNAIEDDFEMVVPKQPKTKQGDVYKLGNHYLMCGDSTDVNSVEKLMGGQKADLLITDPPYNVAYEGATKDKLTIQNDNMESSQFREFLSSALYSANTVMKDGAAFYIWHADSEVYNFRGACQDVDWNVKQCLIWNKNSLVLGRQDYQWKHEPCLYGWKPGAAHVWNSDRKQTTVIDFNKPNRNAEHPTMKPVGLFAYQINNSTKSGATILDLFAGSGTTIIACEQNGRKAYCMELDERYCDVIIERWENLTGEKAVLINNVEVA